MHVRLRAERMARRMTQQELAEKVGIAFRTYADKEKGHHEFKISECKRISEVLGVSLDILFGEEYKIKKEK